MFHTELKQVCSWLKAMESPLSAEKLIADHKEEYYNISRETYELIATLTNTPKLFDYEAYHRDCDIDINEMSNGVCIALY